MNQLSDVTPVVLKQEDMKTEDLKFLPPGISDVPVIKQENLESLVCECLVKPQIKEEPVENFVEIKSEEAKCSYENNHVNSESKFVGPQIKEEPVENSVEIKTEEAKCKCENNHMKSESKFVEPQIKEEPVENSVEIKSEEAKCKCEKNPMGSESTAANGGTGEVKTESAEDVPQTPTLVKTEVEEVSVKDEFPDNKSETAVLQSMEINPQTNDESAAATSASGRPRRNCKRINYSECDDVGREANDQILIPKKTGAIGGDTSGISSTRRNKTSVDSLEPLTGVRRLHTKKDLEPDELVKELLDGKVLRPDQLELLEDLRSRMDLDDASTLSYSARTDGLERHLCLVCAYKTHLPSDMAKHVRCHTREKPFACLHCDLRFVERRALVNHRRIHGTTHECSFCGYRTNRTNTLKVHLRKHTGEKPYVCTVCDAKYVTSHKLKNHMRSHTGEKPYACTQCDFKCARQAGLKFHTRIHLGDKRHKCRFCDYKSVKSNSLKIHLRIHTGERPYSCTTCEYRGYTKELLIRHIRVHTGEKPYVCDICGFKGAAKSNLRSHLTVHSTDKHLCCFYCDYKTTRRTCLIAHVMRHTGPKSSACPYCSYRATSNLMKRHVSNFHNDIAK